MIEWLIIGSAWIWGIKAITTHPFIFYKQANWIEFHAGKWICKPLFRCPVCMTSFWGSFIFAISGLNIYLWPIYIIALAGIQFLIIEFLYPEDVDTLEEEQKKP